MGQKRGLMREFSNLKCIQYNRHLYFNNQISTNSMGCTDGNFHYYFFYPVESYNDKDGIYDALRAIIPLRYQVMAISEPVM